jgi:hypothetical protein
LTESITYLSNRSSNEPFINKTTHLDASLKEKPVVLSKICHVCGVEFFRKDCYHVHGKYIVEMNDYMWDNKIYCSKKCHSKSYFEKNKDKIREFQKAYQKDYNYKLSNPEGYKISRQKQYKKIKSNPVLIERQKQYVLKRYNEKIVPLKKTIYELYNYSCAVCGYSTVLDLHHIDEDSISTNSINDLKNKRLIPLCPNCHACYHRSKFTKQHILKFYKQNGK